jgi:glycine/D-amino acid oxidase-like deaminating enzyme
LICRIKELFLDGDRVPLFFSGIVMKSAQVVIIGAGFAGASTAYHLIRSGVRDILILEQERDTGIHASGRNAGMVRQMVSDESLIPLVREGADFIRRLPEEWPEAVEFQQKGSLFLGGGAAWQRLKADTETAKKAGIPVDFLLPDQACRKVSVLKGGDFEGAVWCSTDGVVDIHALLHGYLQHARAGGAKLLTSAKVLAISTQKERVTAVVTESQTIQTEVVVNAAGAWAAGIARMAGAASLPLCSYRRHLFATDLLSWAKPDWPFVWDFSEEVYFRPESGGLLLSPCDEVEYPPGIPPVDPDAPLWLYQKLKRFPRLCDLPIKTAWADLRTFAADRRFVIGWDPVIRNLFWVAGLGGHGVTASGSIGRLAADLIINQDRKGVRDISPDRFVR